MSKNRGYLLRVLLRWALLTAFIACVLLLAAGTIRILTVDMYLVVLAISLLFMMLAVAPQIVHEREDLGRGEDDRGAGLILGTLVTASLDVGHLHLSGQMPIALSVAAMAVFLTASAFQAWAMHVNAFYSPAIYIQGERKHSVITQGPYGIVRHPAYFANIVAVPASALAIGSWWALIPAAIFCAVTVWRAQLEEAFLKQNLTGYADYMKRVPGGVFPRFGFKLPRISHELKGLR